MKFFIAMTVLAMSLALAGDATAKDAGGKHGLRGKIVSVTGSSVVIQSHGKTEGKSTVTVVTDANTMVSIDGKSSKVSDLTAGLFVRVSPSEGTAAVISATSTKPEHKHAGKKAPTTAPAASN
jgi:hypothetical protein